MLNALISCRRVHRFVLNCAHSLLLHDDRHHCLCKHRGGAGLITITYLSFTLHAGFVVWSQILNASLANDAKIHVGS